jgi:hypothetical protein
VKPETKFYGQIKKNISLISWIRIENLSVPGTPDLLGYNNSGTFFTVELKYTKVFDALSRTPKLYEGKVIRNLVAGGLKLEPMLQGFSPIKNFLENK